MENMSVKRVRFGGNMAERGREVLPKIDLDLL